MTQLQPGTAPEPTGDDDVIDRSIGAIQPTVSPGATHAILRVEDFRARYGVGRDKAHEIVDQPGFPASLVPDEEPAHD